MVTLHGQGTGNAEQEAIAALLPTALIGRLWALVALLLLAGAALGLSRLPSYASGQALLDSESFVALFPASDHATLRTGQPLWAELAPSERVQAQIEQVAPALLDPAAAQQRYGLTLAAPAALVTVRWPAGGPLPAPGGRYAVRAEVGSRTLLSLLLLDLARGGAQP